VPDHPLSRQADHATMLPQNALAGLGFGSTGLIEPSPSAPGMAPLSAVRTIAFRGMSAPDRLLVPIEGGKDAPFEFKRVFTITVDRPGVIGGHHAHRLCSQLLVCLTGVCEVVSRVDDSGAVRVDRLDRPDQGLLIPPTVWAEQHYFTHPCVLMVLCDRGYEAADYLRNFHEFLDFRRGLVVGA
jgi:hypothetical protein